MMPGGKSTHLGPCYLHRLTHWGLVTHVCVSNLTIIGSDNGLSPGRRHVIIWTNAEILLIGSLWTNFNEIEIHTFSLKNAFNYVVWKMATILSRPQCVNSFASGRCFEKCNLWTHVMYPWWRHQMETFSALLALCAGNSPVPVNSPHKGQWRGALMFCLICVWTNGWVNNHEAGDLRR